MSTASTATRERPILFSAPMVRAILDGRKTQTRRVAKDFPEWVASVSPWSGGVQVWNAAHDHMNFRECPYGVPGDRLWVRETWAKRADGMIACLAGPYPYDVKHELVKWRPSIFMPRWASRITLELTEVRVQRVQEISEDDAQAEGFVSTFTLTDGGEWEGEWARPQFARLWDEINAKRKFPFNSNPWVWALSFRRVEP